ncbi:MAG: hypothetical protein AAB417_00690 [Patescibacteria group bacterium]
MMPKILTNRKGFAALAVSIYIVVITVVVAGTFGALAVSQLRAARELMLGKKSFVTAQSGLEDIIRRINTGKNYTTGLAFPTTNGGSASFDIQNATTLTPSITAKANISNHFRSVKVVFTKVVSEGVSFKSGVQAGFLGVLIEDTNFIGHTSPSKSGGDIFSNGSVRDKMAYGPNDFVTGSTTVARTIAHDASEPPLYRSENKLPSDLPNCPNIILNNSSAHQDAAQSFVVPKNVTAYPLSVKLAVRKFGSPPGDMTIRVVPNNDNGTPDPADDRPRDTPVFGSKSFSKELFGTTFTPQEYVLSPAAFPVYEGEKYWIIFDNSNFSASAYYELCKGTNINGTDSQFKYVTNYTVGSDWSADATSDAAFTVYFGDNDTDVFGNFTTMIEGVHAGGNLTAMTIINSKATTTLIGPPPSNLPQTPSKIFYENLTAPVTSRGTACADDVIPPGHECVDYYPTIPSFPYAPAPEPAALITISNCEWQECVNIWKETAADPVKYAGLPIADDYNVSGVDALEGPQVINGALNINGSNGCVLTLTADAGSSRIYHIKGMNGLGFGGNFGNNCKVVVDGANADGSGASAFLIFDHKVSVENRFTLEATCTVGCDVTKPKGHIYIISLEKKPADSSEPLDTIRIQDHATGGVYFAPYGQITIQNQATGVAVSAAEVRLLDGAEVHYDDSVAIGASPGTSYEYIPQFSSFYESP